MTFRVGQKVVCINDDSDFGVAAVNEPHNGCLDGLKKGTVYTVRSLGVDAVWRASAIWLVEIVRPKDHRDYEVGYSVKRFRPVTYPRQSAEHDIALFAPALGTRTPENA